MAEFEHQVEVWSLTERERVSAFTTVLDFGGTRLALVGGDSPTVVAGAYNRHGIRGYDVETGAEKWKRKDLKRVQALMPLLAGRVAAGFDDRALQILSSSTGETVLSIRGVARCVKGRDDELVLAVGGRSAPWVALYDLAVGERLWKEGLSSFAALDAAFGPDAVVVSEADGSLRCFDLDGVERWRWTPPAGEHVPHVVWCERVGRFCGILFPYKRDGPHSLITFDDRGLLDRAVEIGPANDHAFAADGEFLVVGAPDSSAGEVLAVPTGEVVWRFRERPVGR